MLATYPPKMREVAGKALKEAGNYLEVFKESVWTQEMKDHFIEKCAKKGGPSMEHCKEL